MIRLSVVACLFVQLISVLGAEELGLKERLDMYVGRWSGVFNLEAPEIEFQESFTVEQKYWWQDDALRAVSVASRESGKASSKSVTWIDGNKYISEVTRGEEVERYYGVVRDGGIVWFPVDLDRAMQYQLKEEIQAVDGELVLTTKGFDTFVSEGKTGQLLYFGELVKEKE